MSDPEGTDFLLDRRLAWDSEHVLWLELCELRLLNDSRWPWLILVPQRAGMVEIHELDLYDQSMLAVETGLAAAALKAMTGCDRINSGALGNVVSQLHIHVVARNEGDDNWPGPVWNHGAGTPYGAAALAHMIETLRLEFDEATSRTSDNE